MLSAEDAMSISSARYKTSGSMRRAARMSSLPLPPGLGRRTTLGVGDGGSSVNRFAHPASRGRVRLSSLTMALLVVLAVGSPTLSLGSSASALPARHLRPAAVRTSDALTGVRCVAANDCFAVGYETTNVNGYSVPLVEHWNGTSWSVMPSPNPPGGTQVQLHAVSCPNGATCFAVGTFSTDPYGGYARPFVERWNGRAWSILGVPMPTGAVGELWGVSCPAPTRCVAVGIYVANPAASSSGRALIERWNGFVWTFMPSPTPRGSVPVILNGVSCTATWCSAVGESNAVSSLVEQSSGGGWSIAPSPSPYGYGNLFGVSCPAATNCTAVGTGSNKTKTRDVTLVERWNGKVWSVGASPNPKSTALNQLMSLSCSSTTNCLSVGEQGNGYTKPLSERWNGKSWSVIPIPNPPTCSSVLNSVSCATVKECFAVGYGTNADAGYTLIERWNGKTWSIVPSPSPSP